MKTILRASEALTEGICFTVPGKPRGKGRPRFTMAGGYARIYTDRETASYENLVALEYEHSGGKLIEGPVRIQIHAVYPIPKNASKKLRAEMIDGEVLPSCKPDIDNVCKAVLDGLNGVAYKDDTQVIMLVAERLYGEAPRVDVEIWRDRGRFKA
jgi:Holliday junction resolvase RusA-like endonuclease